MKDIKNVLVVNSGSSSLKFTVYDMAREEKLANGLVERIGSDAANMVYRRGDGPKAEKPVSAKDHAEALQLVCAALTDPRTGVLGSLDEVDAIGHRVLHGAEIFKEATLVTADSLAAMKTLVPFGPLHMPPNIGGIEACQKIFPGVPNVAVFDTAFHQTMPPCAARYAIPDEYRSKYGIRKYGFHGTSHHFVTLAAAEFLGKPADEVNLVTCHLGNGSSLAAIKNGKVFDTTMGLTPLAGVVMGTRSGDLDPAVVLELARKGMSPDEIDALLNKKSGLLGVGGINSGDMRDMVNAAAAGNPDAELALEMWAHRIVLYIGGYFALVGGADAIVFTGGIGENSRPARARILSRLACLGVDFDEEANATRNGPCFLTKPGSKVAAIVMPTDEELMIARETFGLVAK
ncbi:MAG: acetate kinase [Kiritimatiellae bacterium]|nr:acetate kinase [Kiritimatiellia bacterium]